jgi:crotonobetainyl-CoA:carnitine CoA-transferase CaiB-like acyl-CoA transferase
MTRVVVDATAISIARWAHVSASSVCPNASSRSARAAASRPLTSHRSHALLATADVFVENFRDGQLEKQGLGPAELRKRYPQLIVCGHKGFLSGPYEHRPALDEVVQMM